MAFNQKLVEQAKAQVEPIAEQPNENTEENAQTNPAEVINCKECQTPLGDDELTINQRFIDQYLTEVNASVDLSIFPLCVKCHFE